MLRSWHNNAWPAPIWKQLDLALVTSTEPYQLIENLNQSPFNVGRSHRAGRFHARAGRRPQPPPRHPVGLRLRATTAGAAGRPSLPGAPSALPGRQRAQLCRRSLLAQATDDRGPFGDHLRNHLFRLHGKADLIQGMLQVIRHHTCPDERVFFRLRGAGWSGARGEKCCHAANCMLIFSGSVSMAEPSLYTVGGTVQAERRPVYPREADDELLAACRAGTFAYILTSRQMGKSSLMVRTAEQLAQEGIISVIIDLTQLGIQLTAEEWYLGLLTTIEDSL